MSVEPVVAPDEEPYAIKEADLPQILENASFLRLKNVVLGYTLPKSVLSKVGIQNLRLYVQAENLLTITGYSGLDPEYTNADMGKESGGDLQRGVDMGGWPSTMRFLFGVNFAF